MKALPPNFLLGSGFLLGESFRVNHQGDCENSLFTEGLCAGELCGGLVFFAVFICLLFVCLLFICMFDFYLLWESYLSGRASVLWFGTVGRVCVGELFLISCVAALVKWLWLILFSCGFAAGRDKEFAFF